MVLVYMYSRRKWREDVAGVSQRRQIKLHTSCDVPAALNHLNTTVVDGARSIFAPTVVSSPDQKIPTKVDMYFFTSGVWNSQIIFVATFLIFQLLKNFVIEMIGLYGRV